MANNTDDPRDEPLVWQGVLDPSLLSEATVAAGHRLADAARDGDWSTVLRLLDTTTVNVNQWRPGGPAWYTPLHQVAWHRGPTEVAAELVARGALRSLPDARGRTAHDIRVARDAKGHNTEAIIAKRWSSFVLRECYLRPAPSPMDAERIQGLDVQLAHVIDGRIRGLPFAGRDRRRILRYPPVAILHEAPARQVWFPLPGKLGVFHIELQPGFLYVRSLFHVVGVPAQTCRRP